MVITHHDEETTQHQTNGNSRERVLLPYSSSTKTTINPLPGEDCAVVAEETHAARKDRQQRKTTDNNCERVLLPYSSSTKTTINPLPGEDCAVVAEETHAARKDQQQRNDRARGFIECSDSMENTNISINSGDIESADDDSCFEPTDGAEDEADDDDDDDQADDDDNNDDGAEIDSYVSANSYLDDDPLASPEEGSGAREATEESRRSAQAGAVNPLRTSNSEEHARFEARDPSGSKIVSVSDEAFALLLIDNYLEKWKTRAGEEVAARIDSVAGGAAAITTEGEEITRRKQTKTAGKYTGKAQGQCKWGGWSPEGIKQFNFLRKLVKADREADKNCDDEPKRMEKLLMDFCRTKAGIKDPQDNANLDGAHNNAAARAMENVEAEWDSDDD
ncbi:hypothetical protein MHU86_3884 [Fragilaria crotonensis]|nr:hypothetical protein MHU86_3884 [Fragilaria crotonensis]